MSAARIRVLCVDDHQVVREGIAAMIGRQPDMEVVASAATAEDAIALFRQHHPDVTLMDLRLPVMGGLNAIREIRGECPAARIVVLTIYQGDEDVYRALEAGAVTYLLKDSLKDDLAPVVREVHAGGRPIPPNVKALLATRANSTTLTAREVEVLELIAKGLRNKEIAAALGMSEETAKSHVRSMFLKLKVNDRSKAVTIALHRGIIHLS
jgi:two-component system NarL family response regulator